MELFDRPVNKEQNLLPQDGKVIYHGKVFQSSEADHFYTTLLKEIEWQFDRAVIFGKTIQTKRKVAWYADQAFL